MGSDKRNGRDNRGNRNESDPRRRRVGLPWAESLEDRRLLTAWVATNSDVYDTENGPMANLGSTLVGIFRDYNNYLTGGSQGNFKTPSASVVRVVGTSVGIDVRGTGDFASFQKSLTALGMQISSTSAVNSTVEGLIPIANLYKLATSAQINGASAVYKPNASFKGIGNNEADQSLKADTARTNYGVDGTGQKIGVLSDSVNQYPEATATNPNPSPVGLAQSVSTGDLPGNVTVLQDEPSSTDVNGNPVFTGTDEGRAMLEQIYDIAPGAGLSFATAFAGGQLGFADNIRALAGIGDKTIVDDVTYFDEAAFQDGFVTNAVNQVTAQGVTYLSSASNNGDSGYMSQFRGVSATVGGTAGRYMNFDPTGNTQTTTLGVIVQAPAQIFLQFDQPLGNVSTNIELDLLDTNGNLIYRSTTNPFATNQAFVAIADANGNPVQVDPGLYKVAVRVVSGADPGHVFIYPSGDSSVSFDHSFGSAGGTYYTGTYGHNAAANAIGVAAVPFWGTTPFQSGTVYNEPYSSFGPVLREFNFDGSSATPTLLLKPDISSPDGNNTSFFAPGNFFDSSLFQIPQFTTYPGNAPRTFLTPRTPTNVIQPNLPIFTGTSSAAPNLAAVVALMKQVSPTVTNAQILAALKATATPVDGVAKGTWSPQGGYGLANAALAIQQIAALQVTSISPGSAATITAAPTTITVTFSKAVNLATLNAGSISVTGANGSTVVVGAPVGVDSSTFPTVVQFPIVITPAPGRVANGVYTVRITGGTIKGQDGTTLQNAFTDTFNLQQTVQPTVTSATLNGRILSISFSAAVNESTLTRDNLFLIRSGLDTNSFLTSAAVVVTKLINPATGNYYAGYSYNTTTHTVTIDLSSLPQNLLPTDYYALIASNRITDLVGNPLNGAFNGVFPSGVNPQIAAGTQFSDTFGEIRVAAPTISTLVLAPASDSGIKGDKDTNVNRPTFVGQVAALFPNTVSGLTIYAQFNGIAHAGLATGGLNLAVGSNGRGVVGQYDVTTTTDVNGVFTINYPAGVTPLPEGQNTVRVVVVGASDLVNMAGLASSTSATFQIDRTSPYVVGTFLGTPAQATPLTPNSSLSTLTSLMVAVEDPINPTSTSSPFAVNPQTNIPALNPTTANNLANYRLTQVVNGQTIDRSSFIKNAAFSSTSNRVLASDPFLGRVDLTFGSGLPQGNYTLTILSGGVTDAVGNSLTDNATDSSTGTVTPFTINFTLQPTPVYITNYGAFAVDSSLNPINGVITGPRADYMVGSTSTDASTPQLPPNAFYLDFSNQLSAQQAATLASQVIIARSADSATAKPDGDFGNFGTATGLAAPAGFSQIIASDVTVRLMDSVVGAVAGQYGYQNRLVITVPAADTAVPDYYRIWLPNTGTRTITDIYGNQLDGEFQGYQNAAGKYVDQLNTGVVRGSGAGDIADMSGDGIAGGAFVTGFVVVPKGNVIYARPDALYNPQLPATLPDGSSARPYPVLAPEASFTTLNNGDLNSPINSGVNFDSTYDRAGVGTFQPSAFFAAQELTRITQAPVVIIAQPALPTRDPFTGIISQRPFVLQAPSGSDPVKNDGSAAIPALTTLDFIAGSALKMQNAALLVQNQGSALQITGGPNPSQIVNVTSYKDSSVGGATNGDPSSIPMSGDYGGILFRNYREAGTGTNNSINPRASLFPGQIPITGLTATDQRLKGPFANTTSRTSQSDAISGADPVMSYINFLTEKYAGGAVPQTSGTAYDGITLQNSRPTITNTTIAYAGNPSTSNSSAAAQAGLSEDYDSLLLDDVAAGPLFRNVTLLANGINGIYLRGRAITGLAQASNATNIGNSDAQYGTARNYVMNAYIPYVLTTNLVVGRDLIVESQGGGTTRADRLYITPGTIVKLNAGSGIEVIPQASFNVGDQTYINQYDANNAFGPSTAGFKANSAALSNVIFTSFYDDAATSTYTDPLTGLVNTVTPALPSIPGGAGSNLPTAAAVPETSRWSGITIDSGARAVVNSATFRFGGGSRNTATGTDNGVQSADAHHALELGGGSLLSKAYYGNRGIAGSFVSITNNTFNYNEDVGLDVDPQALLAGDPQRPLLTGDPFIHGNVFSKNDLDGVGVLGGTGIPVNGTHASNVNYNSTWTGSDFTYILRDTIVLGPDDDSILPIPSSTGYVATPGAKVTLTLQSTLPGTVLADGTVVAAPGVPLIIKTLNNGNSPIPAEAAGVSPGANQTSSWAGGAGFIVGVDDGVDPPTPGEDILDDGEFSQIRILGIPANQSTGQTRVPVTITSVYDSSIGAVVNGTTATQVISGSTIQPQGGDGGIIYFGGNSLTSYNLQDPRSGSIIDNADLKYLTRVEQQGGGIAYIADQNNDMSFTAQYDSPFATLYGVPVGGSYTDQYNSPKKITVSNSNFSTFSDVGFVSHPGYSLIGVPTNYGSTSQPFDFPSRISGVNGEPTQTYFVNDTFSNMVNQSGRNTAIEIIAETGDDAQNNGVAATNTMAVILNSTFYNNGIGVNSVAPAFDGLNPFAGNSFLVMDSIFQKNTTAAVQSIGQQSQSNLQYNLFYQNGADLIGAANSQFFDGSFNNFPYSGDPLFRDPGNGNFNLKIGSAALDRARSEIGPVIFGRMLTPAATLTTTSLDVNGNTVYYDTSFMPVRNGTGDIMLLGGETGGAAGDIVTLPGLPVTTRGFPDEWVPTTIIAQNGTPVSAVGTDPKTTPGTIGNGYVAANGYSGSTYAYVPIVGQRDQLGNLRDKPASTNRGSGSSPFIDLGAFEYIQVTPPTVTGVAALSAASAMATTLYQAGGIVGTNSNPTQIQVSFNERLNTATITPQSVQLIGSGGDGVFGNANDIVYNLNNRLSYNTTTNVLTIDTTGLFPTGAALNDSYRLTLKGTGSSIIQDTAGDALDGYTNNDTLPLPSGSDNFPGSDFAVTFTIDTNPPTLVGGSFGLAPGSFTTAAATSTAANLGSVITATNTPTFVGSVTDIFPPANPVAGDTVYVDISTTGNPNNFDIMNAGVGTTNATGNFSVKLTNPLPDTNINVGADGKLGTKDDIGVTLARVRIVDQSGNTTLLPSAPFSSFYNSGAATGFIVDTTDPTVTSITPTASQVTPNSAGQVVFTATFSENIDPATLTATSILVYRAGGSGVFTGTGTAVPIIPGSIKISYLGGSKGPISVTFAVSATVNDLYRVVLKGTGANPIKDIAGNALNGAGTGNTPSDYGTTPVTVFSPTNSRLIYVDNANAASDPTKTQGTRENPFTTIKAGIAAALTGDTILVLPGTYNENLSLKGQTRLLSADPSSTDNFFIPGNPLATIIRGITTSTTTFNSTAGIITVRADNLATVPNVPTEFSGFTILNPLLGNSVTGTLDTTSIGIALNNSSVTVDKNYIVNAGIGVSVSLSGSGLVGSIINTNVIVGNYIGIQVTDQGSGATYANPVQVINNTIADNTYGFSNYSSRAGSTQAYLLNDIFYNNHALTSARTGTGILSLSANTIVAVSDLFYNNGVNNTAASSVNGTFGSFINPSTLSSTPNTYGNFVADPAFVAARDPRPDGDTPAVFFLYANYDLSSRSAAINLANKNYAPATDILYRTPVSIPGKSIAGSGPASIGAFYYLGAGGITPTYGTPFTVPTTTTTVTSTITAVPTVKALSIASTDATPSMVGGSLPIGTQQFAVVNTSLNPDGVSSGKPGIATTISAPQSIQVNFSDNVDSSTLKAADLVLSGTSLDSSNPARATGLSWVDSHTVNFLLTGEFKSSGSLNLSIPDGVVKDTHGDSIAAYAESFVLASQTSTPADPIPTTTPTTTVPVTSVAASAPPVHPVVYSATSVTLPIQPVALAGPIVVHYSKATASFTTHHGKPTTPATKKAEAALAAAKVQAAKHAATVKQTAAKHAAAKAAANHAKATK